MSDRLNSRPAKRRRTRTTASRTQAPQAPGFEALPAFDPTLGGQTAPNEEDILYLYEAVTWPPGPSFRQILQPAPLPSPLSPALPEWLDNTAGDPLRGIKQLYDLVLLNYSQLRDEFALKYPYFGLGVKQAGFLVWAEYVPPSGGEYDETPKRLNGVWLDKLGLNTLRLDFRKEPGQNRDYWMEDLKIHGLKKDSMFVEFGATEYHYFISNDSEEPFSVNGVPIAKGMVAGPLPDFAVIDIDGFLALWWASQAGIEYVPKKKQEVTGAKRSYDAFQEFENLNDTGKSIRRTQMPEVSAIDYTFETVDQLRNENIDPDLSSFIENFDFETNTGQEAYASFIGNFEQNTGQEARSFAEDSPWCTEYKRRLRECTLRPSQGHVIGPAHKFHSIGTLGLQDVVLAIASVWRGSFDEWRQYAFGNADLFDMARLQRISGTRCVRPKETFIIPLVFDPVTTMLDPEAESNYETPPLLSFATHWKTTEGKSDFKFPALLDPAENRPATFLVDHMILAVAQLSGSRDVKLTFFDNCKGKQSKDVIRRTARNIVRNSAWLLDTWPNFTEEIWEYPPLAISSNSAVHTVLNAWAFMLDIQLSKDWPKTPTTEFYPEALKLINIALEGRLDGWTIRAFLKCCGYAAPEALETVVVQDLLQDAEKKGTVRTRTHGMTPGILNAMLQGLHELDEKPTEKVPTRKRKVPTRTEKVPTSKPPAPSGARRRLRSRKVQPGLEDQSGLQDQPVPEDQTIREGPTVRNKSSRRLLPKGQPILQDQPNLESQPNVGVQPSLEGQPILEGQPGLVGQPNLEDQARKKGKSGRKPKPRPAGPTWETRLEAGIEESRRQTQGTPSTVTPFTTPLNIADDQLGLAIASVWEGLRQYGIEFAYGTTDCFRFNRSPDNLMKDMTVVLQPNPLIMPLLFVPEYPIGRRKAKGHNPVGHWTLAVAERSSATSEEVRLIFMDSFPDHIPRPRQSAAAQGLVRYSGWMGVDAQGHALPTNPTFTEEWRACPRQECGNTCGFYLILNAWAYMLGIPVHTSPFRRDRTGQRGAKFFQAKGLEIINLAIAGHMNSSVIQAFLNHYGYSRAEDLDATSLAANSIPTAHVTLAGLEQFVQDCRLLERTVAASVDSGAGATQ